MAGETLDDVLRSVTAKDTLIDSVAALMAGLKQRLDDALAGTTLPPAVLAKIEQIFTLSEAQSVKLNAAIIAGTDIPPTA